MQLAAACCHLSIPVPGYPFCCSRAMLHVRVIQGKPLRSGREECGLLHDRCATIWREGVSGGTPIYMLRQLGGTPALWSSPAAAPLAPARRLDAEWRVSAAEEYEQYDTDRREGTREDAKTIADPRRVLDRGLSAGRSVRGRRCCPHAYRRSDQAGRGGNRGTHRSPDEAGGFANGCPDGGSHGGTNQASCVPNGRTSGSDCRAYQACCCGSDDGPDGGRARGIGRNPSGYSASSRRNGQLHQLPSGGRCGRWSQGWNRASCQPLQLHQCAVPGVPQAGLVA